jgi:hypothetical protein
MCVWGMGLGLGWRYGVWVGVWGGGKGWRYGVWVWGRDGGLRYGRGMGTHRTLHIIADSRQPISHISYIVLCVHVLCAGAQRDPGACKCTL